MSMPAAQLSFEEQVTVLVNLAQEKGDDFNLRINRRATSASPMETIASFRGARVEHVSQPEAWLPLLCGGGTFILGVSHASDPARIVATLVPAPIAGPPKPIDLDATSRSGWTGPTVMTFPKKVEVVAPDFFGNQKPGGGGGGNAGPRDPSPTADPAAGPSQHYLDARLGLMEAQSKIERDNMQRAISEMQKASERQIAGVLEVVKTLASRPVEQPKSLGEQIAPLLAVAAPLLTAFMQKSSDDRKSMLEEQRSREERDARQRDETFKVLIAMNEKAATAGNDVMKIVAPLVESVSMMGNTVLRQVATMQELQNPAAAETTWMDLAKAGMEAFVEMQRARAPQAPAQRALPPQPVGEAPAAEAPPDEGEEMTPEKLATLDPAALAAAFEANLREKTDAAEVADVFTSALAANAAFAALVAEGGGPIKFFQARLGAWVNEPGNADYVRGVVMALVQRNVKVG